MGDRVISRYENEGLKRNAESVGEARMQLRKKRDRLAHSTYARIGEGRKRNDFGVYCSAPRQVR